MFLVYKFFERAYKANVRLKDYWKPTLWRTIICCFLLQ